MSTNMEKWFVAAKKADFNKWAEEFGISPVLARILRNRDMTQEEEVQKFLNGTLEDCYSPWLLYDMDKAVSLLQEAVMGEKHIRVIGDYDVDGICASYILTRGLELLGAKVDAAIPHRIHDGYGINEHLIREAGEEGVDLIVTCDNGIAAAQQVRLAVELGMSVIITDHHEVPFVIRDGERQELLPPAAAIVNPRQERDHYPYPGICGGVVAYKLMEALREKSGNADLSEAMEEFLEFAAMATVCDVMELKDENRIIVKEGLKRLRTTRNPGVAALAEVNGLDREKLSAYHLGFVLGPCLNATGRLDTARRALELLRSRTKGEAMTAAAELKALNDSRKNLTTEGVALAEQYLLEEHREQDKVMVIYLPKVHESLAGIIAGRIREKYNRPVFILTKGEEGVKGSGRSIPAYHMYEAMTEVKEYFTRFGGHRLAAGLSMREEDILPLRKALNEKCRLTEEDFIPKVHIDIPMPLGYGGEELAKELERLEPFGVGNPRPLFAQKDLIFKAGYKMGRNKTAARFSVLTSGGEIKKLVFFGDLERFGIFLREKFGEDSEAALYNGRGNFPVSVVYQLGQNTYNGRCEVQYIMQNYCCGKD